MPIPSGSTWTGGTGASAAEQGVLCVINPDAHEAGGLEHYRAGVNSARKGWLTKEQVLNTRRLEAVRKYLRAR